MTAALAKAQAAKVRVGHGSAFGAITILNATATGRGCALAVAAGSRAEWQWRGSDFVADTPGADDNLARTVWQRLAPIISPTISPTIPARGPARPGPATPAISAAPATPLALPGAAVRTHSVFPPARGLKTSSGVAGALVRAAYDAAGQPPPDWRSVATHAIESSRQAGVTLTGAFDDQVAVLRGGAHLTDNREANILESYAVPDWHIAVWVPQAHIPKSAVAHLDASVLKAQLEPLARRLDVETLPAAMTANGRIFHDFYAAHGLPVDDRPTQVALEAGALGAGLSGTGPAVAAIFRHPTTLAPVAGGEWTWTRAVGLQA